MVGIKILFSLILGIFIFTMLGFAHFALAFQTNVYMSNASSGSWSQSLYPVSKSAYLQNIEASGSYVVAFILQRKNTANTGGITFDIVQNGVTLDSIYTPNTSGGELSTVPRSAYFIPIPPDYDPQYDIEIIPSLNVTYTTALYAFSPETIDNSIYPIVQSTNNVRRWSSAVILASSTVSTGGTTIKPILSYNESMPIGTTTCTHTEESSICTNEFVFGPEPFFYGFIVFAIVFYGTIYYFKRNSQV